MYKKQKPRRRKIGKYVKMAHAFDTKQYNFIIVQSCSKVLEKYFLFLTNSGAIKIERIEFQKFKQIDNYNQFFKRKSCLIITQQAYRKCRDKALDCFYLKHVFVVKQNKNQSFNHQKETSIPNKFGKKCPILQSQCANNFFSNCKQSYGIKDLLNKEQKQFNVQNAKKNFQEYLSIIGHCAGERKDFIKKYCHNQLQDNILRLYTSVPQFYQINIILRRFYSPQILKNVQLPAYFLHKRLKQLQIAQKMKQPTLVYRGGKISKEQVEKLQQKKGLSVQCKYFMSCSYNRNIAERFRKNCIFSIQYRMRKQDNNLNHFQSEFEDEEEVIFNIFSVFKVIDVYQDKSRKNQSWIVHLEHVT